MSFKASIIKHSISPAGKEIVTYELRYPRFIHGEVMTHRVFSRNAMSSRAIPVIKMIKQVWSDPAMPVYWGANQAGMQAAVELAGWRLWAAKALWKTAAKVACVFAWGFNKIGLHKQIANRILEPFQWMTTLVTATEWDNFFELRDHPDAQPEFRFLAKMMRIERQLSKPTLLKLGEWHLPYVGQIAINTYGITIALKLSTARCARVSYLTHDGLEPNFAADIALFNRLAASRPIHASPLEHQATPGSVDTGNFVGWTQHRKLWEKSMAEIAAMDAVATRTKA